MAASGPVALYGASPISKQSDRNREEMSGVQKAGEVLRFRLGLCSTPLPLLYPVASTRSLGVISNLHVRERTTTNPAAMNFEDVEERDGEHHSSGYVNEGR